MANTEKARWNGHSFIVSSSLIRTFSKLHISGSCETEEKTKNKDNYADRKNGKPTEITLTAYLNAYTGCKVREEALSFVDDARAGKKDYLYVGGSKIFNFQIMLTNAFVSETEIASNNVWIKAEVQLTFKQTGTGGKSVNSGGSSGGGGSGVSSGTYSSAGSSKVSVKSSSTVKKLYTEGQPQMLCLNLMKTRQFHLQ